MNATRQIVAWTAVALTAHACGQVITTAGITANISMSWTEDPAFSHNSNGILEPGEHALVFTSISFTGQFTHVSFSPAVGQFTSGTILGLGYAFLDITGAPGDATGLYNNGLTVPTSTSVGPNANAAGTFGYGVRTAWRVGGNVANGSPASNGFINIAPGQFPSSPATADTTNPISNIDRLGWAPNSFTLRDVIFSAHPSAAAGSAVVGLYLDLDGGTSGAVAAVPVSSITFGSVQVMYNMPGPGGLCLLGPAGLLAWRRRRGPAEP